MMRIVARRARTGMSWPALLAVVYWLVCYLT